MAKNLTRLALVLGTVAIASPVMGQDAFYGNIISNDNGDGPADTATISACGVSSADYAALEFSAGVPANQVGVNAMLMDPYNRTAPNFMPMAGSPALTGNVSNIAFAVDGCSNDADCSQSCEGGIGPVCYAGAIGDTDWTEGWTYYNFTGEGRTDIDFGKPLVILEGALSGADLELVNTNNYLIRGRVSVEAGDELDIQKGTVLLGEETTAGFLVIERDASIRALGTADQPIIMTSDQTPGTYTRGGWGGLVIHGNSVANCADCFAGESCESEGGTAGFFCGTNDCDDSGEIRYVRVEYAGVEISTDNELNAFTFNGVGCGFIAEYLQAAYGFDDLFEWFGGKASARWIVGVGGGDDGIDWQMGWRGGVQFGIIQAYDDDGDKGIEADNNEFDFDAPCRSNPVIANCTFVGPDDIFGNPTDGINIRRGTDAQIFNCVVTGWPVWGLQVQNDETCARGFSPSPGIYCGPDAVVDVAETPAVANVALKAFPNPVLQRATFAFELGSASDVALRVFDIEGRLVDTVASGAYGAGSHQVAWSVPAGTATGTYFYRLSGSDVAEATGRLIVN